jgi:hypothetical protein
MSYEGIGVGQKGFWVRRNRFLMAACVTLGGSIWVVDASIVKKITCQKHQLYVIVKKRLTNESLHREKK